jgi:hypothetical protein
VGRGGAIAARAILLGFGLLLCLVTGELALRAVYHDAGRRTLGGPGGESFEHLTTGNDLRGRRDVGPRRPGVPRVMVIGDSITYGLGVRDWRDTWPERLALALEQAGRPHEFAVFAVPGNEIPQHVRVMREWSARTQPDILIYQWYVNDIEAMSHRPEFRHGWQRQPWHTSLSERSYLYFVLEHRLSQFMTPPNQTYVSYLLTEFAPGTAEWAEFEREFHELATLSASASRRILLIYPQVPFRGRHPLQTLHDRMRVLAGAHALEIPPLSWTRSAGALVASTEAPRGYVLQLQPEARGVVVQSRDYLFVPGPLTISVSLKTERSAAEVAMLELFDPAAQAVVASLPVRADTSGTVTDVPLNFTVSGDRPQRLTLRVVSTGQVGWGLANLKIPVDYGFEVVDLTQPLNSFNTHTSAFDAHPNERAHQVIADVVQQTLQASH